MVMATMLRFPGGLIAVIGVMLLVQVASSDYSQRRGFSTLGDGRVPIRSPDVQMLVHREQVVMSNGIIEVTLSIPQGFVLGVRYKDGDNLLDSELEEDNRGYWDVVWNKPGSASVFDKMRDSKFQVIKLDREQIELSFTSTWDASAAESVMPLNVDRRFVMLPGKSGFYCYGIFEHEVEGPDVDVDQVRIVFKLDKAKFNYMAMSDRRHRVMPRYADRETGQPLAYPEAVKLTNAADPAIRGEVDDKYQYSCENKDNNVHGWISYYSRMGFWMITPSNEFRNAGPLKQDLTSHVGPFTLSMFVSTHYGGKITGMRFQSGERWKKVFGPVFVYVNSALPWRHPHTLWNDAKHQMMKETGRWPYNFPSSEDFPSAFRRGSVSGQLVVCDQEIKKGCEPASLAYVGLALPGEEGSWQTEAKGYQFWNETDEDGNFFIGAVRAGSYSLYGWVPGVLGDFMWSSIINVRAGSSLDLGGLVFFPPRSGPTLWEIGIPDRKAAEFFVPAPDHGLVNKLYLKHDKFRQYGLWRSYAQLYPRHDLRFTIGISDFRKDWFYAQVTREVGKGEYKSTTWKILFHLGNVTTSGTYVLRVALASATASELQIRFNQQTSEGPYFTTGLIGQDNAIARHGIHGLYWLYSFEVSGIQLIHGRNIIFLTQTRNSTQFAGIMYDYIRLEGPIYAEER